MTKPKTTEQITEDLAAAQAALSERAEQINAAQAAYQRLLTEEALGRAKAGASRLAKEALADAEHLRDIASARVTALEAELADARDREDTKRAEVLAGQNASLTEKQDELAEQIDANLRSLVALLAELDETNAQGTAAWSERRRLSASLGLSVGEPWNARSLALGDDAQKPLAKVIDGRHTARGGFAFLQ